MQRSQKTTAALLLDEARPLLTSLLLSPTRPTLRVAAVGGGPGFEAVGLVALAEFLDVSVELECLSMDIEQGWGAVLGAVVAGTCDRAGNPCCTVVAPESLRDAEPQTGSEAAGPRHRIAFVSSDCLTGHAGPDLHDAASSMDLFTFNYCMVENTKRRCEWTVSRTCGRSSRLLALELRSSSWTPRITCGERSWRCSARCAATREPVEAHSVSPSCTRSRSPGSA